MWAIVRCIFGSLASTLSVAMLVKPPPDPSSPSPELWAVSEKGFKLRTGWIKDLSDLTTEWAARGLYQDSQIICVPAMLTLSSNQQVEFTGMDGGLKRRAIGIFWPVVFVDRTPQLDNERQATTENIKVRGWYTPERVAAYLVALHVCKELLMNGGPSVLNNKPVMVQDSTDGLLSGEFDDIMEAFLAEECVSCDAAAAVTKGVFTTKLSALTEQQRKDYGDAREFSRLLARSVENLVSWKNYQGRKNILWRGITFLRFRTTTERE